jgi:hypothetical protein
MAVPDEPSAWLIVRTGEANCCTINLKSGDTIVLGNWSEDLWSVESHTLAETDARLGKQRQVIAGKRRWRKGA